ncbi:Glyoxalase/bleomycin resistance protein/dioxygenase [Stachybotrys elegans]|uniref:Glyoxalase/bleomycin resistance protein/dioxygenase n=1 Tax=Stachybotrys elegans TaxID=80388 RepID=A0A8K0SJK6_9HYPO|nr:Glyoxalase/bleomycin resistance protein/dioxygenase [Stachybotrys elegans]
MASLTLGSTTAIEITAQDAARAKQFYASVFGWIFSETSGSSMIKIVPQGAILGGGIRPESSGSRAGPGGVTVYLSAVDIKKTLEAIEQSGGSILEPAKRQEPGFAARFADTEGNVFGLFSLA